MLRIFVMPQGHYKDQLQWQILIDIEDGKTGYVNIKCSVHFFFFVHQTMQNLPKLLLYWISTYLYINLWCI